MATNAELVEIHRANKVKLPCGHLVQGPSFTNLTGSLTRRCVDHEVDYAIPFTNGKMGEAKRLANRMPRR